MITKNFVTIWFCNAPLYCLNLSLSSSDIGSLSAHPNTFKVQTDLSSFFMRLVICGQVYKVNDIYNLSIIYEFQNQNWANSCWLYTYYTTGCWKLMVAGRILLRSLSILRLRPPNFMWSFSKPYWIRSYPKVLTQPQWNLNLIMSRALNLVLLLNNHWQ